MVLSGKEERIIDIVRSSEMTGLEIVKASMGHLKRGGIYTTLSRMEDRGLIESRRMDQDPPRLPRRMYRVTGSGMNTFLHRHSFLPQVTLVTE